MNPLVEKEVAAEEARLKELQQNLQKSQLVLSTLVHNPQLLAVAIEKAIRTTVIREFKLAKAPALVVAGCLNTEEGKKPSVTFMICDPEFVYEKSYELVLSDLKPTPFEKLESLKNSMRDEYIAARHGKERKPE